MDHYEGDAGELAYDDMDVVDKSNDKSNDEVSDEVDTDVDEVYAHPSTPVILTKSGKRKVDRLTLRMLERSDRYFWQRSYKEQVQQTMADKHTNGGIRLLPPNEITVMALNEICAHRGRGFFFFFKSRDAWKKPPSTMLCPPSRAPPQPGSVLAPYISKTSS